ncbi:hypothetical protein [Limosilactobacillus coleohominis]|uniref:Uncharacterized protein n=1 Tax=Limosilactobacillus coleohominis TaxID=181675 RepID=A0ABS2H0W6_9LACO|nr:hypothetical protein [Limosilactobacillus coleohominis]MBM6941081.1 hypothetical protein [Limosilactobacillus coleohominis]
MAPRPLLQLLTLNSSSNGSSSSRDSSGDVSRHCFTQGRMPNDHSQKETLLRFYPANS